MVKIGIITTIGKGRETKYVKIGRERRGFDYLTCIQNGDVRQDETKRFGHADIMSVQSE